MGNMTKKVANWIGVLALGGLGLFSCRKETSVENKVALSGDFRAQINGVQWVAADATKGASMLAGLINITGISSDNKKVSITLTDTVQGVYTLDQTSSSYGAYSGDDSSDIYAFSTNQGMDTTQAGGQVVITEIDHVNKTLTGTFSFKVFRDVDGRQKVLSSGVFYRLPYVNTLPPSRNGDTMQAKIESTNWTAQSINAQALSGQLVITGSLLDGNNAIGLIMPSNVVPGTYSLDLAGLDYLGLYNPTPSVALASYSGTVTILSNNTVNQRIRGNFQFKATDPFGMGGSFQNITNGFFSVYYGN
jgi:hypothetical protein